MILSNRSIEKSAGLNAVTFADRVRQTAYFLWMADGCPDNRDWHHWFKAERLEADRLKKKKKRPMRSGAAARVAHLKRLVGQHPDASNLGARGVVWALMAVCESLEAAIDFVAKPPPELAAWLGEDLSFDAYQLLKAWQELSESQIEEELQEAERLFGDKNMDTEVPELIAQATETFLQQLPALLIDHSGQWVGYCGRRRIAFGPTKRAVFEQCVAENIAPKQMLIRKVQPDVPVAQVTW